MATKKRAAKKKVNVDWSDEDSVLAAMAAALDCDPEDLTIEEAKNLSSFGAGDIYLVERGREEYYVAENDEVAHDLAVAIVKQDLEEEPGNFEPNFIESHINLDRLRRDLQSDVEESLREQYEDEASRHPERFLEEHEGTIDDSWLEPLRDESGNWKEDVEVPDQAVEEVIEHYAEEQLKDPVAYLTDMLGQEDGTKKAIEIGGIDIDAAADEAVSTDGEGHFLSSYDGNVHDGPGGIVWWRHN